MHTDWQRCYNMLSCTSKGKHFTVLQRGYKDGITQDPLATAAPKILKSWKFFTNPYVTWVVSCSQLSTEEALYCDCRDLT